LIFKIEIVKIRIYCEIIDKNFKNKNFSHFFKKNPSDH